MCVHSTNLRFSVGYVLCTRYVCTTLYDTRYVLCTRYVSYQVHVCTTLAVVLLIVQLYRYLFIRHVGGGTHDTYVPPKKQLYRYLFIR